MSSLQNWPPSPPTGTSAPAPATGAEDAPTQNAVLDAMADDCRRAVLYALLEGQSPRTERDLATELADTAGQPAEVAGSSPSVERIETALRHVHLPRLRECALVEWDESSRIVSLTNHAVYDDPSVRALLEMDADVDDVLECLVDDRRRLVLAVLHAYDGAMDRSDLAREVTELESSSVSEAGRQADPDRDVQVSLHHVHLPKLEDAGLIERDPDDERVSFSGHDALDESWFSF